MKTLTLHQPWASLVAAGLKTNETRSWSTRHRGLLAIHAGQTHFVGGWSRGLWEATEQCHGGMAGYPDAFPKGAVLATCQLIDMVATDNYANPDPLGDYTPGRWVWVLADIKALEEPVPAKGHQGLWNWEGL